VRSPQLAPQGRFPKPHRQNPILALSSQSLQQKAVSATLWSAIDSFARRGLQFAISLVLARLLSPEDYGTVGLLAIFIGVAAAFTDSGFFTALIQRKEVSETDLSSVFYFNIGISLLAAAILGMASPLIAAFYKMPVLLPLMWLLAGNLVLTSLASIQSVLLWRSLNFRRQCIISLTALVVSGAVAIILAWRHYGVWSLAIQTLVCTIINAVLLWTTSSWRPTWVFSVSSIRSLFKFGGFVFLTGLIDTLFTRLNTLVIGKFYSARDLGYYSRADSTSILPGDVMSGIIGRVAFPIYAAAQDDKALLKAGLRKSIILVMMLNIPIMLGLAVTARALVLVLFGNQWLPCVPYLQILCLGGILVPLHMLNLRILLAQGHSDLYFKLEIIKKSIGVLLMGAACFFGIAAIAWSSVLTGFIGFGFNAHYSGRFLGYGFFSQTLDLLPYVGAGLAMGGASWAISFLPITTPILMLATQISVGAIIYVSLCAGLRLKGFVDAWSMVRPVLAKRLSPKDA